MAIIENSNYDFFSIAPGFVEPREKPIDRISKTVKS